MAGPSEKTLNDLTKSLVDLVDVIKKKNSFGSDSKRTVRMGRGGSSNASDASGENFNKSIEGLKDLHKSMKSGGMTIADHFKKMAKSIDPLNKAIYQLEDTFSEIADKFGKEFEEIAKSARDYIKENKGNIDKLQDFSKLQQELVDVQKEILKIHEMSEDDLKKNAVALRKLMATEKNLREKFSKTDFAIKNKISAASGVYLTYLKRVNDTLKSDVPKRIELEGEMQKGIKKSVDTLDKTNKTIQSVFTAFANNMSKNLRKAEANLIRSAEQFGKQFFSATLESVRRIPATITSRIQHGHLENEYSDAIMMGLSPQELNEFKSSIRDVTNALSGLDRTVDTTSTLREWRTEMRRVGLTGKEAADMLGLVAQNAYDTGQALNQDTIKNTMDSARELQQAFKGSIGDNTDMLRDYTTQAFTLSRLNTAATDEERKAILEESKKRILLAKYMEVEIDYLKQQESLRHASAFGGLSDTIEKAVHGMLGTEVAVETSNLNWSEADKDLFVRGGTGLTELSDTERLRFQELSEEFTDSHNRGILKRDTTAQQSGLMAAIGVDSERLLSNQLLQSTMDVQNIVDKTNQSMNKKTSRGDVGTIDEYRHQITRNADLQDDSVGYVEEITMAITDVFQGMSKSVFGPMLAAIGANVWALGKNTAALWANTARVGGVFGVPGTGTGAGGKGKGKGRTKTGRVPTGAGRLARGRLASAAILNTIGMGAMTTGGFGDVLDETTPSTKSKPKISAGRLAKSLKGGSIGGLIAGITLGTAADTIGTDTKTGAGLDVAADVLGYAGTGALIGSIFGPLGTAIGGILGGVGGGAYSLYKNRETLFGDMSPESKSIAKGAALGSLLLPGIGTLVGGTIGAITSGKPTPLSVPPADRNTVSFAPHTDSMNQIQRDVNGNPIIVTTESELGESTKKLVELTEKQVELAENELNYKRQRDEQRDIRIEQEQTIGDEIAALVQTIPRGLSLYSS